MLNVIVLMFEVLYYSLFIKFSRPDGKFYRYILLFTLISLSGFVIGTTNVFSYFYLIFVITYGIKYIVKLKISLYDMFTVFLMLILKFFLELTLFFILIKIFENLFIITILIGFMKIILISLLNRKITILYKKWKIKWNDNVFEIRYIFNMMALSIIIFTSVYLLLLPFSKSLL